MKNDTDENRESGKKPQYTYKNNLITFLLILLFTVVSVSSYVPIKAIRIHSRNDTRAYIEGFHFANELGGLTRYLFNSEIRGEKRYRSDFDNIESIKYYLTNEQDIHITNMGYVDENVLEEQIKDSLFYVKAIFDENGNLTTQNTLGYRFNQNLFISIISYTENKMDFANLTMYYIMPQDFLDYQDVFTFNMKAIYILPSLLLLILTIGIISIFLLVVIAFCVPYSIQKRTLICTIYNKLFLEVKALLWASLIGISIAIILTLDRNSLAYYSSFTNIIYEANSYFFIIGIPITLTLYMLIYLSIVNLKYIYYTGFLNGFLKNSVFINIPLGVIHLFSKPIKELLSIDITKDPHKKIFGILLVNITILWLVLMGGPIMFIIAGIYSVFIFKYLTRFMLDLQKVYNGTSQLAEGDFNITLDEEGMLKPINENLNNIKEGFQLAVDKEIKSQKMKAELISNVSHDLKTPLTSIITYIDLLKKEPIESETQKEYIEILDKKSKRLNILIEDLFEASKASSGNIDINIENIDVIALFRQTIGELEEKIEESSLTFKWNLPENKVMCQLDGKRTYRIFDNVMNNIFKYAMENSRVYIDVIENEKEIEFVFKNISAYEMNFDAREITERFVRGDESRNTEGSGLGLSIAKSLVELQNGRIDINIDGDLFKVIIVIPKHVEQQI